MSPRELEGKYRDALEKIGGANGSNSADRQKPIYDREPRMTEQQAIQQAANALAALWKLKTR